jgi:hypothetical protein
MIARRAICLTNMQSVARQHLFLTHHTTREKLLEAVFSMDSILRLYNKDQWDMAVIEICSWAPAGV